MVNHAKSDTLKAQIQRKKKDNLIVEENESTEENEEMEGEDTSDGSNSD